MSDRHDEFDTWLREAYASTWPDFGSQQLAGMRRAFEYQATQLLDAKRNEKRMVAELKPEHRDGESYLVWHDGEWKCAHYEDGVGVWVGWWVTGGDNRQPMRPKPVYYRPLPPDLDGES